MLLLQQKFEHVEAHEAFMDFVLADLKYNVRRVRDDENSHKDNIVCADMKAMQRLCGEMPRPEARGKIFCSGLQFET